MNKFRSSDNEDLEASAKAVRDLGITTFAVGVGDAVASELRVSETNMSGCFYTKFTIYFLSVLPFTGDISLLLT